MFYILQLYKENFMKIFPCLMGLRPFSCFARSTEVLLSLRPFSLFGRRSEDRCRLFKAPQLSILNSQL